MYIYTLMVQLLLYTCTYIQYMYIHVQYIMYVYTYISNSEWQVHFVDAILSNNSTDDHIKEFISHGGLPPLLRLLSLPCLPLDFPFSLACSAITGTCKSILVRERGRGRGKGREREIDKKAVCVCNIVCTCTCTYVCTPCMCIHV